MSEAGAFFQKFADELVGGLNTVAIGQIEAFDATKAKANVKLLPDGDLILGVPVAMPQTSGFIIRMPYTKGDYVVVVFAQRDIDGVMYGGREDPSGRMLAVDDAIVIGGLNLFTTSLPATNAGDLVVASKDFKHKVTIAADGKMELANGAGANITMDATGAINIVGPNGVTITGKTSSASY
jgi:hypothetical protein